MCDVRVVTSRVKIKDLDSIYHNHVSTNASLQESHWLSLEESKKTVSVEIFEAGAHQLQARTRPMPSFAA